MTAPSPEALLPPPRRVRLRRGHGWWLWRVRLATLPHCAFGLWLTALALYLPVVWFFGEDVPGHVADKYTQTDSRGRVGYYAVYAYAVGGVEYRDRTGVSREN